MGKQVSLEEVTLQQGPAKTAWDKYNATGDACSDPTRIVFVKGWNAALAWIPFRIQQFREIEEGYKKEIEELKRQKAEVESLFTLAPPVDSKDKTS